MTTGAGAPLRPTETLARFGDHAATLPGSLAARVAVQPRRTFLVEEERSLSYGAAATSVEAFAGELARLGVGPGDRVAAMAPTGIDLVLALFAIVRLGAVFVPINPELRAAEAAALLRRARPSGWRQSPPMVPARGT